MKLATLAATAALVMTSGLAQADFSNAGFENGTLNGWTTVGNVSVQSSFSFFSGNNYAATVTAPDGNNFALLSTQTAFFGMPSMLLQGAAATSAPLVMHYRFLTQDGLPFNDALTVQYATLQNAGLATIDTLSVGNSAPDSGWKTFVLPKGTTYVSLFLQNQGDNQVASFAAVDFSAAPVPEPETWALMLAGLGMLGFAARRKSGN